MIAYRWVGEQLGYDQHYKDERIAFYIGFVGAICSLLYAQMGPRAFATKVALGLSPVEWNLFVAVLILIPINIGFNLNTVEKVVSLEQIAKKRMKMIWLIMPFAIGFYYILFKGLIVLVMASLNAGYHSKLLDDLYLYTHQWERNEFWDISGWISNLKTMGDSKEFGLLLLVPGMYSPAAIKTVFSNLNPTIISGSIAVYIFFTNLVYTVFPFYEIPVWSEERKENVMTSQYKEDSFKLRGRYKNVPKIQNIGLIAGMVQEDKAFGSRCVPIGRDDRIMLFGHNRQDRHEFEKERYPYYKLYADGMDRLENEPAMQEQFKQKYFRWFQYGVSMTTSQKELSQRMLFQMNVDEMVGDLSEEDRRMAKSRSKVMKRGPLDLNTAPKPFTNKEYIQHHKQEVEKAKLYREEKKREFQENRLAIRRVSKTGLKNRDSIKKVDEQTQDLTKKETLENEQLKPNKSTNPISKAARPSTNKFESMPFGVPEELCNSEETSSSDNSDEFLAKLYGFGDAKRSSSRSGFKG